MPPALKLKPVPPPAVNIMLDPVQNILSASELVSVGVGNGFIVKITGVRVPLTQLDVVFLVSA
jgi:hypothetical protein